MTLEFEKNCIGKNNLSRRKKTAKHGNYINLNRPEWDGILDITADWYERGVTVTLVIVKDSAPVDGAMMTFTRRTLVNDLRDPVLLKIWREKWGDHVVNAVEDALMYINFVMNNSFRPLPKGDRKLAIN